MEGIGAGNPDMPSLVEGGSMLLMQIKITTITM
jgi:hypothetical protein